MAEKSHAGDPALPAERRDRSSSGRPVRLRDYRPPTIETLGDMRDVTRKSGTLPDAKQLTKPGKGGG